MKSFNAVFVSVLLSSSFFAFAPRAVADNRMRNPIRSAAGSGHGCPCPYDQIVRTNGKIYRCGKTSAWSRPGGIHPTCYDSDLYQKAYAGEYLNDWSDTLAKCWKDFYYCKEVYPF